MSAPSISDLIQERLDDPVDIALNGRPYVEALRGVLRVHRSREAQGYYGDTRLCCTACHQNGYRPVWPCMTVLAIAEGLGIEGSR